MAEARFAAAHLTARVTGLFTCERKGEPMIECAELEALAGIGIAGDRYATNSGFWSFNPAYVSEITFVEDEAIEIVRGAVGDGFSARACRRNVLTRDIVLDELIGVRFTIGDALFEGVRPCDPCTYLDALLGLPVRAAFDGRGGLRASILRSGTIRLGAPIVLAPASAALAPDHGC